MGLINRLPWKFILALGGWAIHISVSCTTCSSASSLCFLLYVDFQRRATTHTDLVVRAKKLGIEVKVVHNASVMNAIGICGLQLYRYGETVSIPFFTSTWRPNSFYEKIQKNRMLGLHTLCLLGAVLNVLDLPFCLLSSGT